MHILSTKTQKAKKQHSCDYCYNKINIGELYQYSAIVNCGDFYAFKNHISCQKIAEHLKMFEQDEVRYEGLTSDNFQETICEEYYSIMKKCLKDVFTSKEFKIPSFNIQLNFVINYYKIS